MTTAARAPWWIVGFAAALALPGWEHAPIAVAARQALVVASLAGLAVLPIAPALGLLVAISIMPGDGLLLIAELVLLARLAARGELHLTRAFTSLLFCAFWLFALASALFGFAFVEARPVQWFAWFLTMGVPMALLGLARVPIERADIVSLTRLLGFCLAAQLPIGLVQLYRHGALAPGDWFAGTWDNANMVGLWAACAASVAAARLIVMPRVEGLPSPGRVALALGAIAVLVWFASAKIFAASMLLAGAAVIVVLWMSAPGVSRVRAGLRASGAAALGVALAVTAHSWVLENAEGFAQNWNDSGKHLLFDRVFGEFGGRYNALLGVGPGMLGSRAASIASADVLFKDAPSLASRLLGPAPEPERWAMRGLWTAEVAEDIASLSALIAAPFSGWATIRAELGWPAVAVLLAFLLVLAIRLARIAARHPQGFFAAAGAAVVCAGLPIMLVFDNVLEQPHVTGPLVVLVILARAAARHDDAAPT